FIGNLHILTGNPVAYGSAGLVYGQDVAVLEAITGALVQGDHIELADLRHTARHVENQAVDFLFRLAGHKGGIDRTFFTGKQAITDTRFLSNAGQHHGGDITFHVDNLCAADVIGIDAEELSGFRVDIGLALAEDAVDRDVVFKNATAIDPITRAADNPFGITRNDIGRTIELFRTVDDAVAQQKAVDRLQRDGGNGFGHRCGAHRGRELDGAARSAAVEHQPWLAINIDQAEAVTGIDQVRVFHLGIGMPEFRPLPGFTQKSPRDVPERVAFDYGVLLGMICLELNFSLGDTANRHQQQGE